MHQYHPHSAAPKPIYPSTPAYLMGGATTTSHYSKPYADIRLPRHGLLTATKILIGGSGPNAPSQQMTKRGPIGTLGVLPFGARPFNLLSFLRNIWNIATGFIAGPRVETAAAMLPTPPLLRRGCKGYHGYLCSSLFPSPSCLSASSRTFRCRQVFLVRLGRLDLRSPTFVSGFGRPVVS